MNTREFRLHTLDDIDLAQRQIKSHCTQELKSKVNSIARTLKGKGLKVSETIIKEKIFELYPNSEDWKSGDARLDVIRAIEKAIQ